MRTLLIFIAAIVVIVLGAWATLVLYFDEERLKTIAVEQVRSQTGRELVLGGPLELKVFPRISLVARDVTLSGPDRYSGPELFQADQFRMSLALLPLLRGEVETGAISLERAEINIHTDRSGSSSLDGLGGRDRSGSDDEAQPESDSRGDRSGLTTEQIRLDNVRLIVSDAGSGDRQQVLVDRLELEAFRFDAPVGFVFEGSIGDPVTVSELKVTGTVTVPSGAGPVQVRGLELNAVAAGLPVALSGQADVQTGSTPRATFPDGQLRLGEDRFEVSFSFVGGDRPRVSATLRGESMDVDRLLDSLPQAQEDPDPAAESPLLAFQALDLDAELALERMQISGLTLTGIQSELSARNGVIRLEPLRGALSGGRVDAVASIDVNPSPAVVTLRPVFELESLGEALSPWGLDRFLSGSGRLSLDLNARGLDAEAILASLYGSGEYGFRNGAIQGLDFNAIVSGLAERDLAQAALAGVGGETRFRDLTGVLNVTDGTVLLPDLNLVTDRMSVNGDVAIGLADLGLDGRLRLDDERFDRIPLSVGGTLLEPKLTPQVGEVIRQEAGRRVLDFLEKRSRASEGEDRIDEQDPEQDEASGTDEGGRE